MHGKPLLGLAAAIALSAGVATAQEQTFNVYGFADAAYTRTSINSNHFLYSYLDDDLDWGIKHFNLYFDYKPNSFTRALLEVGFIHSQSIADRVTDDRIIITNFTDIPAQLQAILPTMGFASTRTDTAKFSDDKSIPVPFIERAYFDVLLGSKVNFRLGRFITPAGIWNADHGSPVILPVKQPNQTSIVPIFPQYQDGISLFGNGYFGDHDYDYTLYVSTGSDPEKNNLRGIEDLSGGGHAGLRLDLPVKVKLGVSGYSGLTRTTKIYGVTTRNIPYSSISTPNPQAGGLPTPDPAKLVPVLSAPPSFDQVEYSKTALLQDRHLAWGVDARFDMNGAFLQSEFNQRTSTNELTSDPKDAVVTGFYVIGGYKHPVKDWLSLTPYLMYEGMGWEDVMSAKSLAGFGSLPMEGFDVILGGVNVGLYGNLYVKIEYAYSMMRDIDSPPAMPFMKINYDDGETDVGIFSTQFSIAF